MQIVVWESGAATVDASHAHARALARPGDTVVFVATVPVPGSLPVDAPAGELWGASCRAERALFTARQETEGRIPVGVGARYVRVQARTAADALLTAAAAHRADLVLLPNAPGVRGALSARFGTVRHVLRRATCPVLVIGEGWQAPDAPMPRPAAAPAFRGLHIVAANPAFAVPEKHHAS